MRYFKTTRLLSVLRSISLICGITCSILIIGELSVRFFVPQVEQRVFWNGVSGTMPDAELRYVLTPNYHAVINSPEFTPDRVVYKTNSEGLRDHRTYNHRKPPDTTRILVVGDSFAYGAASNYREIWPFILERQLTERGYKVEVIKAGVFGYDTRTEILYLKRLLPKYKPDVVILAFLLNDLFTNAPLSADLSQPDSARQNDTVEASLIAQKIDKLHLITLTKRLLLKSDLVYTNVYLRTQRAAFFEPSSALLQRQLEITKLLISEGHAYAARNSAELVVVSIAQAFQVINTEKTVDVFFVEKELEKFARKSDFLWISSVPLFIESYAREREDLHYRLDGHLNRKGNLLVANLVAAKMADFVGRNKAKPLIDLQLVTESP